MTEDAVASFDPLDAVRARGDLDAVRDAAVHQRASRPSHAAVAWTRADDLQAIRIFFAVLRRAAKRVGVPHDDFVVHDLGDLAHEILLASQGKRLAEYPVVYELWRIFGDPPERDATTDDDPAA